MIPTKTKEYIKELSAMFRVPATKFPMWSVGTTQFIELPVTGLNVLQLRHIMNILPANMIIRCQSGKSCIQVSFWVEDQDRKRKMLIFKK